MDIPKQIKTAIEQNKLIIFSGAGLSKRFNLPDWKKLVKDVINEIDIEALRAYIPLLDLGDVGLSPIEVLEKLKNEHNTIRKYIRDHFKIEKGDLTLHKNIIDLSGQIVTTNYDDSFEKASDFQINSANYTSEFNVSEISKDGRPFIFKLHGSYNEADKCILFNEDYERLYSNDSAAKEKLKSIFIEKTILFVGFSFSDPDINLIFDNLDKVFKNNNKHFILTKEPKEFKKFHFISPIEITNHDQIEIFIGECLKYKKDYLASKDTLKAEKIHKEPNLEYTPKIAILYPKPLDIDFKDNLSKVVSSFDSLNAHFHLGSLNQRTLTKIEDYDLLIIVSKVFKSKLYVEDDNLKSSLFTPEEICSHITNDQVPVVFITNEKIVPVTSYPSIYIESSRSTILNRFIYKALKNGETDFNDEEIFVSINNWNLKIEKGKACFSSIYNNNRDLSIGRKALTSVVGRIEEQAALASRLISILSSNKLLNIKASGGTGKTTLVKKIAYELYNRGYYTAGVTFKSCESIKTYSHFEETLIEGFNLNNILEFKQYLIENYSNSKIDCLIILDNFETVVNKLQKKDLEKAIELLKFSTDYANIVVTSRERIAPSEDFEDVFSLTSMITDDALILFQENYGEITDEKELRILRTDILEDLLNNNPLAIKLVTKSRTRFGHISELKQQIKDNFFESTNEDYTLVFKDTTDLNIERTKSIYQSINYSYTTLNSREKIGFELLSLFPDGISLSNFKKCFEKSVSSNRISDRELRTLKDKSLLEDYNGTLQLQPIIRRFAEWQFSKRSPETKQRFCTDAYRFNCYVLNVIRLIEKKKNTSEALKLYVHYKNNLLNVLSYIQDIDLDEDDNVKKKKYLLNYIYEVEDYFINEKQIEEFNLKVRLLNDFFSDVPNAQTLIEVLLYSKQYYHKDFDEPYKKMSKLLSVQQMEERNFDSEDYIETRYNGIISTVHSMEGFTLQRLKTAISNKETSYLDCHIFYLGIPDNISRQKDGFYFFEYEFMLNRLNVQQLETYIDSLYLEEHLEIMQCTYILSKIKPIEKKTIQKLVVTNPYTRGLKELMYAFNAISHPEKISHFEAAISNLYHIKYYYLEALYYYCKFLKKEHKDTYEKKLEEGVSLSEKYRYQYMNYLFKNIDGETVQYNFTYDYYELPELEHFIQSHNKSWEKYFKENDIV
jgi:hypothetical protein